MIDVITGAFTPFGLDYLIWVFLAAMGALQVAAATGRLSGLLLVPKREAAMSLGLALATGATLWFFLSFPRNQPDTGLGLDGNQQAVLFSLGSGVALLVTLAVSSTLNRKRLGYPIATGGGLQALRRTTWARAVAATLRASLRKEERAR